MLRIISLIIFIVIFNYEAVATSDREICIDATKRVGDKRVLYSKDEVSTWASRFTYLKIANERNLDCEKSLTYSNNKLVWKKVSGFPAFQWNNPDFKVPLNAKVHRSGWSCNKGYVKSENICSARYKIFSGVLLD